MTKKPENERDGALTHNPFAALAKKGATAVPPAPAARRPAASPSPRAVRARLESAGRSGKVITRLTGLPAANLDAIAARLARALGCHATVQGDDVILSGSLADRASKWLNGAGDLGAITEERRSPAPAAAVQPADTGLVQNEADQAATQRGSIRRGVRVAIVLKADQDSGRLTEGIVREILTSSPTHPRGIKVRLESGEVGRVKVIYG